ncbi:MAG: acyl-CoA dehydrogenase family protein [Oscillospiraceae bacterium]|jgi:butyryl-CoA dehydrogenase|nr:acyl-CoA dehydrogenase family protein [Oscillospiraceae bacterium]
MVDFKLTQEQEMARKMFQQFAEEEIKPLVRDMDEAEEFDFELLAKMHKYGLMGIPYPKEYGGQGGNVLTYALGMEEVSKIDPSVGITISVHTSLCCSCIYEYGSEEQKQTYLRPLIDGTKTGCFGLTEPNAGTDAGGVLTTAVKDGDEYVLNGQKVFITNSGFADTFVIFAMTDKSLGTKGMSAFILDKGMPGLEVSKNIPRMGIRASQNCEIAMMDVRVPADRLIAKEGMGYKIGMGALAGGRIGIGAQAVGIAQGAINETVKYVKERKQFGKTISKFQNTQFKLAEMQVKTDAARLMVWRAAVGKDNGEAYAPMAAACKLFASEVANEVTRLAVQLFGGYGYSREYPVEKLMRDAKITEIYEGTSEAMKMIVGGGMLK